MKTIGDDLYHVEMSPDKPRETPQKAIQLYLPALGHEHSVLPTYMEIHSTCEGHQPM